MTKTSFLQAARTDFLAFYLEGSLGALLVRAHAELGHLQLTP